MEFTAITLVSTQGGKEQQTLIGKQGDNEQQGMRDLHEGTEAAHWRKLSANALP